MSVAANTGTETMRRYQLVLTFITVAGWSQTVQPQAQPPIPVRIEMPPESVWMVLLKVVLPTVLGVALGSGITLYGMRQSNKHNAAENKANREHQLQVEIAKAEIAAKYKSQDNRWEFRKEVYYNTIKALFMVISGYMRVLQSQPLLKHENAETRARAEQMFKDAQTDLKLYGTQFMTNAIVAPLAQADDVAAAFNEGYRNAYQSVVLCGGDVDTKLLQLEIDRLTTIFGMLTVAGRKDLWGTPEDEVKPDTAT
jgi:hypothetical protein